MHEYTTLLYQRQNWVITRTKSIPVNVEQEESNIRTTSRTSDQLYIDLLLHDQSITPKRGGNKSAGEVLNYLPISFNVSAALSLASWLTFGFLVVL